METMGKQKDARLEERGRDPSAAHFWGARGGGSEHAQDRDARRGPQQVLRGEPRWAELRSEEFDPVLNMYDPNDVANIVPEMATPEFMQDVQSAFKAVLAHVERINHGPSAGPNTAPVVDTTNIAYEQYIHGLS